MLLASDFLKALTVARFVLSKSQTLTPFMKAKASPGRLEAYNGEVHVSVDLDIDWDPCLLEVDPIIAWLRVQPGDAEVKLKDGKLLCKRSRLTIPIDFESVYQYPEVESFEAAFDTVDGVVQKISNWIFPAMGGEIELMCGTFGVWFIQNKVFSTNNMIIGVAELDNDQFFDGQDQVVVPPSFVVPLVKIGLKDPLVSLMLSDDDRTQAKFESGIVLTCTNITHGLDIPKVHELMKLVRQDTEADLTDLSDIRRTIGLVTKLTDDDRISLEIDPDDLHISIEGASFSFDDTVKRSGRDISRGTYKTTVFSTSLNNCLKAGGDLMYFTDEALIISDYDSYLGLAQL